MKLFLVGGAVRDQLLGLPVKERDWVVVGSNAQELLSQGFQQVGRDFPVFLHPQTHEEYALARIEKKQGSGYHGFVCDTSSSVTLEEDLARRDLTINAMALDSDGHVIDPYNGQLDLQHKLLRHVSDAFVEDPVRVLRLARFKARFHHLGFELAPETRVLMQRMVRRGELAHLIAERVWREWELSLTEKNPEMFISILRSCGALKVVLPEIDALFGVPNKRQHHPEVDVGIHTLMALTVAAQLSNDPIIRFATILHDIGKAATPMAMWPNQHGHELRGLSSVEQLCQRLRVPKRYQKLALLAARWHGELHAVTTLSAYSIVDILDNINAYRDPATFEQLLTVCEADSKGRWVGSSIKICSSDYQSAQLWRIMLAACGKLTAEFWVKQGLTGKDIKEALYQARVACVSNLLKQ